jgi:hypothetical protein
VDVFTWTFAQWRAHLSKLLRPDEMAAAVPTVRVDESVLLPTLRELLSHPLVDVYHDDWSCVFGYITPISVMCACLPGIRGRVMDETFSTVVVPGPRGDTAQSTWTLAEVLERLWKTGADCMPILDQHDALVGVVTCAHFLKYLQLAMGSDVNAPRLRINLQQTVGSFLAEIDADEVAVEDERDGVIVPAEIASLMTLKTAVERCVLSPIGRCFVVGQGGQLTGTITVRAIWEQLLEDFPEDDDDAEQEGASEQPDRDGDAKGEVGPDVGPTIESTRDPDGDQSPASPASPTSPKPTSASP